MIENVTPKVIQNGSKIKLWAPRSLIFEILGGFDRGPMFDDLVSGKEIENKSEKKRRRCEKSDSAERVGGRDGVPEELLESARSVRNARVCKSV